MASRTLRRRATYRAAGRHSQGQGRASILRILLVLLIALTMFASGASAGTMLIYGDSLPSLQHFKSRFEFQNTLIRDKQGNVLYNMADVSRGKGRRVVEPLIWPTHTTWYFRHHHEDWLAGPHGRGIPVLLQSATIATEDASFYGNLGFDPLSIARASYDNLVSGHIVSGASTITQQLVREYMLEPAPTFSRKTAEILLAAELTQKYPKSKILWYYLNSVPYGNLSYGSEAAAETYFNKHVWELDLAQSALLSGLPEAPTFYDPVNNLPAALNRMRYVLHLMYVHGYLLNAHHQRDASLIDKAMAEAQHWKFRPVVTIRRYPHFVEYSIEQLQSIPQLRGKIYNGLDVYTTLNTRLQDMAQGIVKDQISSLGDYNVTDGALVAEDLRPECYGCILAMVGSADYHNAAISGQINMANTPRQPGSSFKPFNYIYAFQHGLSPATNVLDGPVALPDPGNRQDGGWFEPQNYDHTYHGTVSLRVALANSLNVPAVKVEQFSGVHHVAHESIMMGIRDLRSDNPHCCGWALTLGGLERGVRLVQEASAYGTLATGGRTAPATAIWKVFDRSTHKLLYYAPRDERPQPTQVMPPQYAYIMNNVLSDNNARCQPEACEFGTNSPLNLSRTAAAKTGTTNSFTDNWTVGYTPDLVAGVWVGNANGQPMVGTTGITGAAPIWHDFMESAFGILNEPPKDFVEPPNVYEGSSCREPGTYLSYGSFGYDIYAGIVPYCSVGTSDTSLPIPQQPQQYQAPVGQQPTTAPAPQAAPTQVQAPAPTPQPQAGRNGQQPQSPSGPAATQPPPQTAPTSGSGENGPP